MKISMASKVTLPPDMVIVQAVTESLYVALHGLFTEPFRVMLTHHIEDKNYWICQMNFYSDSFPFQKGTRVINVVQVRVERGDLIVSAQVPRVSANKEVTEPPSLLCLSLEDPNCFTVAVNEVFEIALDFCRVHYKRAVKDKHQPHREAIKTTLRDLAETLRKRRKGWQQ